MTKNEHNDASSALRGVVENTAYAAFGAAFALWSVSQGEMWPLLFWVCFVAWCWRDARREVATLKAHLGTAPPVTSDSADFTKLYDAIVAETRRRARLMYGARGGTTHRREG